MLLTSRVWTCKWQRFRHKDVVGSNLPQCIVAFPFYTKIYCTALRFAQVGRRRCPPPHTPLKKAGQSNFLQLLHSPSHATATIKHLFVYLLQCTTTRDSSSNRCTSVFYWSRPFEVGSHPSHPDQKPEGGELLFTLQHFANSRAICPESRHLGTKAHFWSRFGAVWGQKAAHSVPRAPVGGERKRK